MSYQNVATLDNVVDIATVHDTRILRLVAYYQTASEEHRAAGRSWYADQREVIRDIATAHKLPVTIVAAVVSSLSPQCPWERNIAGALRTIRAFESGESEPPRSATVYYSNAIKAWAILHGSISPESAFQNAPKTRAFWRNLSGDESHATVDIWMARAAGLGNTGTADDGRITARQYREVAQAIKDGAQRTGETVAAFQAIVWVTIRGSAD